jgi:hypothetical protein
VTAFQGGAVLAIVQTMYRYEACVVIQWRGIDSLAHLSCCNVAYFQWDIIKGRGIECCIWSMGKHKDLPMVLADGCLLIANLLSISFLRKSIVDEGGLKVVVNAMVNHQDEARVQEQGCRALSSYESSWAKAAADSGGTRLVISAMNKHLNHAEVQVNGATF